MSERSELFFPEGKPSQPARQRNSRTFSATPEPPESR
ncbi:hypothetical protein ABIE59_001876 [Marinobacter sp. MBR-99]